MLSKRRIYVGICSILVAAVQAAIGTELHTDTFPSVRNRVTRLQSPKLLRHLIDYSVEKERNVELSLCSP